jgi:hypothetical protein
LTPDKSSAFNNTANLIAIFSSLVMSLITVLRLGFKSREGKYYLFLVVGIALWALAHTIWAYFELVLGIVTPYPSIADFFLVVRISIFMVPLLLFISGLEASQNH